MVIVLVQNGEVIVLQISYFYAKGNDYMMETGNDYSEIIEVPMI